MFIFDSYVVHFFLQKCHNFVKAISIYLLDIFSNCGFNIQFYSTNFAVSIIGSNPTMRDLPFLNSQGDRAAGVKFG